MRCECVKGTAVCGKGRLRESARELRKGEGKNSSHEHLKCDTLVSSIYIKARACRARNLTPCRSTLVPLEMATRRRRQQRRRWQERRLFVALFDLVFTEIAFIYAPRTKIKQIWKCLRQSRWPSTGAMLINPFSWQRPYPFEGTHVMLCMHSYRFRACSLLSDLNLENPVYSRLTRRDIFV